MKEKASPINTIWLAMILISVVVAAYTGHMEDITKASFDSAKSAVTLAIGLIGAMALWLGLMKILEAAGALNFISKLIYPLMKRLFPHIPEGHAALSAIIMNVSANMLGLGNAATPIGIKAMKELDEINPKKGTATDSMVLFLAINTSSITILPLGVITVRAVAGADSPANIIIPAILATLVSTITAIFACKFFSDKSNVENIKEISTKKTSEEKTDEYKAPVLKIIIFILFAALIATSIAINMYQVEKITFDVFFKGFSNWLVPLLIAVFLLVGYFKNVKVYEVLTEGAKEGFNTTVRIIPFMVAIFVAIGMFRSSGALDIFALILSPLTDFIGMPADVLPLAVIRPLSGSGSFGIMAEIVNNDPNSFSAYLASIMQGSTETTFYVVAVYFGAVGIVKTRHVIKAALLADFAGIAASLIFAKIFFEM
ncbi:MAG: spore maturation protein [Candidatus Delongbacteria bacterium]|jgi:spore maturation protein SpmA|nr:spore maturation protein [Candidatus Delongbacteria bacterium]